MPIEWYIERKIVVYNIHPKMHLVLVQQTLSACKRAFTFFLFVLNKVLALGKKSQMKTHFLPFPLFFLLLSHYISFFFDDKVFKIQRKNYFTTDALYRNVEKCLLYD